MMAMIQTSRDYLTILEKAELFQCMYLALLGISDHSLACQATA
jgi:hypothetical protein